MRSKRKEVNKYSHKQTDELKEGESELQLRRNAGAKPFQLTKLRLTHRHINDTPLPNNELLHRRTGSNHFFNDLNEINLDLIIKQKLIIDAQFNQKLESERKNLIYLDVAQDNQGKSSSQTGLQDGITLRNQSGEEEHIEDKGLDSSKQKGDFPVFLQQNQQYQQLLLQAERRHETAEASLKHNTLGQLKAGNKCEEPCPVVGAEEPGNCHNQQEIMKMEIKLLKQKTHPPFSFTSVKWRSKSENLQIDKWKQKYNREAPALIKQMEKQILNERQKRSVISSNQAIEQKNTIHSHEKQKVSLPSLQKMKEVEQTHSKVKIATKKSHQKEGKSLFRIESHPEMKTHHSLQLMPQRHVEPRSKRAQQESLEEKVEIIIKKMYESQLEKYQETAVSEADYVQNTEQQEGSDPADGKRKKKSKFPQIQITTFTSTKELETQKKKEKLEQIQRLAKQWRYVAPRKTYVAKVMEEIPERWQYGESRESSRQEVDDYLLVKQQEKREYEKVKSQQLEAQSGETNPREVGFLFLESRLTND